MSTPLVCNTCQKTINGTYVTCSQCGYIKICTQCHLQSPMTHDHPAIYTTPTLTVNTQPTRRFYGVAKMFSSENGRGRCTDDSDSYSDDLSG